MNRITPSYPPPINPSYKPKTSIVTLPATTPLPYILAVLERDGGIILENFASSTELSAIEEELKPWSQTQRNGHSPSMNGSNGTKEANGESNGVGGAHMTNDISTTNDQPKIQKTKSDAFSIMPPQTLIIPGLVGKSPTIASICSENPLLESLRRSILLEEFNVHREDFVDPHAIEPLLSLSIAMNIGCGAPRQRLHRDDNVHGWRHDYSAQQPWSFKRTSQFGCLIAGCDITRAKGATMFVPGSHRWDDLRVPVAEEEVTFAEMSAGSALIFLAACYHGGGHNSIPNSIRPMYSLFFIRGTLRTEENQFLAIPRSKLLGMNDKMLDLLGWKKPTAVLGTVDGGSPHEDLEGVWESVMK